jgi:hypothetical protein
LESCGANDFTTNKNKSEKNNRSWIMILGYYVVVLTGVLLFYLIPQMALLFIIVSSYHFGGNQCLNQTFPNGCWYYFSFIWFCSFTVAICVSTDQVQHIISKLQT